MKYLFHELDKTLAFLGLISASVLTIWLTLAIGRVPYIAAGILLSLGLATYLVIRESISSSFLESLALEKGSSRLCFVLDVFSFLLFAYSVLSFLFRPNPYVRPIGYFIAITLMASVTAMEILFLPPRRRYTYSVLLKIVLIGLSLGFSQLLLYPSVVGQDPWDHQTFTLNILNIGHIPEGYGYSSIPFMHLLTGSTSLITGLDYKMATMLSVSLAQVICNVLFTFLLGQYLFNKKVGLLGGLLLAVANWEILMGFWAIPNSLAAVFIPIILYLLLKGRREKGRVSVSLVMVLMGAIVLTHTVTSAFLAILLFAFWAGFKVYNSMYREWKASMPISIPILFAVGMFSLWTFASGYMNQLGEMIKSGFSLDYLFSVRLRSMPAVLAQYAYNLPLSEQLFDYLGLFLFFVMSLIGCLWIVSKRIRTSYRFVMVLGGAIPLFVGSFAILTNMGLIVERWWYFSQILLALPLAMAFFLFCRIVKNKKGQAFLLATMIFPLTFLMIISPTANVDNPTFSPNSQVRFALTESELHSVEKILTLWNGNIGVDEYYSLMPASNPLRDISEELYNRNFTACQDMFILVRTEIVYHPVLVGYMYRLDYDPRGVLAQDFSRVYDCDSVSGFVFAENYNSTLP